MKSLGLLPYACILGVAARDALATEQTALQPAALNTLWPAQSGISTQALDMREPMNDSMDSLDALTVFADAQTARQLSESTVFTHSKADAAPSGSPTHLSLAEESSTDISHTPASPNEEVTGDKTESADETEPAGEVMFIGGILLLILASNCVRACVEDGDNGARGRANGVPQNLPRIPDWSELELADEEAPPVEESCPISLEDFDWLEQKPTRIHFSEARSVESTGKRSHYNNKWYAHVALETYILGKLRAGKALEDPTTRQTFTLRDLRQARPNTRIEGRDLPELELISLESGSSLSDSGSDNTVSTTGSPKKRFVATHTAEAAQITQTTQTRTQDPTTRDNAEVLMALEEGRSPVIVDHPHSV